MRTGNSWLVREKEKLGREQNEYIRFGREEFHLGGNKKREKEWVRLGHHFENSKNSMNGGGGVLVSKVLNKGVNDPQISQRGTVE